MVFSKAVSEYPLLNEHGTVFGSGLQANRVPESCAYEPHPLAHFWRVAVPLDELIAADTTFIICKNSTSLKLFLAKASTIELADLSLKLMKILMVIDKDQ